MEIRGKKALITGAASGIGRATALAMAVRDARLFITDIDSRGLEEARREIEAGGGEVCLSRALGVSDYEAMKALADEIHAGFGPLDILANVAGVALFSQVEEMTHEQWRRVVDVKMLYLLKRFFPPAYVLVMRIMTWLVDCTLTRKAMCSQAR